MERIGATSSREAIRMPISQMQAVSRRAQVGSPFALPWPKTCGECAERGAGRQFPGGLALHQDPLGWASLPSHCPSFPAPR